MNQMTANDNNNEPPAEDTDQLPQRRQRRKQVTEPTATTLVAATDGHFPDLSVTLTTTATKSPTSSHHKPSHFRNPYLLYSIHMYQEMTRNTRGRKMNRKELSSAVQKAWNELTPGQRRYWVNQAEERDDNDTKQPVSQENLVIDCHDNDGDDDTDSNHDDDEEERNSSSNNNNEENNGDVLYDSTYYDELLHQYDIMIALATQERTNLTMTFCQQQQRQYNNVKAMMMNLEEYISPLEYNELMIGYQDMIDDAILHKQYLQQEIITIDNHNDDNNVLRGDSAPPTCHDDGMNDTTVHEISESHRNSRIHSTQHQPLSSLPQKRRKVNHPKRKDKPTTLDPIDEVVSDDHDIYLRLPLKSCSDHTHAATVVSDVSNSIEGRLKNVSRESSSLVSSSLSNYFSFDKRSTIMMENDILESSSLNPSALIDASHDTIIQHDQNKKRFRIDDDTNHMDSHQLCEETWNIAKRLLSSRDDGGL